MKLPEEIERFIEGEALFQKSDRLIVGASAGGDSTALSHILHKLSYNILLAHVHFGLRGTDADEDARFVEQLASDLGVGFRTTAVDTKAFAKENKMSVQEAARALRYRWFEDLRQKEKCQYIAVGTTMDDQAETMIYNLSKGCGPAGLHGIMPSANGVVRPLIRVRGEKLRRWLKGQGLKWREDKSNTSTKYMRNRIRHHIIPELEQINPSVVETLGASAANFRDAERAVQVLGNVAMQMCTEQQDDGILIDLGKLVALDASAIALHAILLPFGFNRSVLSDLCDAIGTSPGKCFYSATHQIILDRDHLILSPRKHHREESTAAIEIDAGDGAVAEPLALRWTTVELKDKRPEPDADAGKAWLDCDRLTFPLLLRPWQPGDAFIPLGMKGHKKVSDFLIDVKCPLPQKEDTFVLISGEEIVWLAGYRIADPFKAEPATKRIFKVELL